MAENKIEIKTKEIKTYSIENLTYGQIEVIYRALMVFEPKYPGGEEAQEELIKALQRWV